MHKRLFEAAPLGGPSVKAAPLHDERLRKIGRRFVKELNWTGVMMVEFKKEAETGEYYLIEINPKFWGSLELSYKNGVNFPLTVAEYYINREKGKHISYTNNPFSWCALCLNSYSKYGPRVMFEALKKTYNKNILFTDFHIDDPKNLLLKVFNVVKNITSMRYNHMYDKKMYIRNVTRKIMKNVDYLIFDMDGTLINLNVDWNKVKKEIINEGIMNKNDNFHQTYYSTKKNDASLFDELNKKVELYELEKARLIKKDLEYMNLLSKLQLKGVESYVVSKQSRNVISLVLENLGIKEYVKGYLGREDYTQRREQIHYTTIMHEFDDNSNSLMFGDVLSDVVSSLKSGVEPVYVVNSGLKRLQAEQLDVSYTYDVKDVLRLIV